VFSVIFSVYVSLLTVPEYVTVCGAGLPPPPPPSLHEANKSENANTVVRMILLSGIRWGGGDNMTFVIICHSFLLVAFLLAVAAQNTAQNACFDVSFATQMRILQSKMR
jgi:hypothetical protein